MAAPATSMMSPVTSPTAANMGGQQSQPFGSSSTTPLPATAAPSNPFLSAVRGVSSDGTAAGGGAAGGGFGSGTWLMTVAMQSCSLCPPKIATPAKPIVVTPAGHDLATAAALICHSCMLWP